MEVIDRDALEIVTYFIFCSDLTAAMKLKRHLLLGKVIGRKEKLGIKAKQYIKKKRHNFADRGLYCQSYGFSSSHVWI